MQTHPIPAAPSGARHAAPSEIRPACPDEYAPLCALFAELDEHHRHARPDTFHTPTGPRRDRTLLDALIAGPDSAILVAEDPPGPLLGLAVLLVRSIAASPVRRARRFVEIDNLVVRTFARRRGVGRALIAASRDWAASRGIPALELSVWTFNIEAIALYRVAGFTPAITRMVLPTASPHPPAT